MFRSGAGNNLLTSGLSVIIKHTIIVLTHNKYECKGTLPMNEEELDLAPSEYEPPHPHDSMPIANGTNRYAPPEKMTELESNPRPEEEAADWFNQTDSYSSRHKSTPDHEKGAEEVVTMHEQMYRMATARYNPFHMGASENYHADIEYAGGSEQAWWTDGEQKFTPENDPYGGY